MVDFSTLLRKLAGEAKKPPTMPAGDYPAVIKAFETGDNNKNKTPYVRFQLGFQGFPPDVEQEDIDGIDLSKRQMRADYYLTEDAMWRLDELLRTMGLDMTGKSYEEILREAVGQEITAVVVQGLNQQTNEIYASVSKVFGPNSAN